MAREITAGQLQLVINQGHTVLITDRDGQMPWPTNKGYSFLTLGSSAASKQGEGNSWAMMNCGGLSSMRYTNGVATG